MFESLSANKLLALFISTMQRNTKLMTEANTSADATAGFATPGAAAGDSKVDFDVQGKGEVVDSRTA
jgi:hypothetical protein